MNRNTGTPGKSTSPSKPVQPPRKPAQSAQDKRRQQASAEAAHAAGQVEGEGSYTAARRYNEGLSEHIKTHDVESEAEEAREALEGDERQELERAEERGKLPAKR